MILIDDRPYPQPCPPEMTVRDLAREICADTTLGRRLVVSLHCDGRPVADAEMDAVLDAPADSFDRLDLVTQPVAALVRTAMHQAMNLIDDASACRDAAADALERGERPAAMSELQKFLDIWRQVQESMLASAEALGVHLDSLDAGGCRFSELIGLMKTHLTDLRSAMRTQDLVLVGDILRYELEEVLTHWRGLLAALQSAAEAAD